MALSSTFATRHRRSFFATIVLVLLAIAPLALAQTPAPKHKKKGAKPAASASASASEDAAPPTPPPTPTPSAEPSAAPAASSPPDATTPPEAGTESVAEPAADDATNTTEAPDKTYTFVGARYRGTVIPAFLEHLFVDDGATVYSNTIGAEIDWRKEGKSTIAWLQYTEYGFNDTLFLQKGKDPTMANNYSDVNSGLKGIYIGVDEVWSSPIANHLDFEYGFGLGLGAIFGNLYNNWVYQNPNGPLVNDAGTHFSQCQSQTDGNPALICSTGAHQNASVAKVGNFAESSWFGGGPVPVVFPHIGGQLGLRYKPIKQLETRLDLGISITGIWFGLSADYGLEKTAEHDAGHPASTPPAKEKSPGDPAKEEKESRAGASRDTL